MMTVFLLCLILFMFLTLFFLDFLAYYFLNENIKHEIPKKKSKTKENNQVLKDKNKELYF